MSCSTLPERALGSPPSTSQVSLQYDNFLYGICVAPCHPDPSPRGSRKLPATQPSRQGVANSYASSSACVDDPSGGSASQGLSKPKGDGSNPSLYGRQGHRQVRLSGACGIGSNTAEGMDLHRSRFGSRTSRAVAFPRGLCPMFDSWCGQACMQPILQPMKNDCLHESAQSLGQQNGFPPEWLKGMDAWAQRNARLLARFVAFLKLC